MDCFTSHYFIIVIIILITITIITIKVNPLFTTLIMICEVKITQ